MPSVHFKTFADIDCLAAQFGIRITGQQNLVLFKHFDKQGRICGFLIPDPAYCQKTAVFCSHINPAQHKAGFRITDDSRFGPRVTLMPIDVDDAHAQAEVGIIHRLIGAAVGIHDHLIDTDRGKLPIVAYGNFDLREQRHHMKTSLVNGPYAIRDPGIAFAADRSQNGKLFNRNAVIAKQIKCFDCRAGTNFVTGRQEVFILFHTLCILINNLQIILTRFSD